jgi:hypothetical protein
VKIEDVRGVRVVESMIELDAALTESIRAGVREFWLSDEHAFPAMAIWVKDDLATLHFFREEAHPGLRSIGTILPTKGIVYFAPESTHQAEAVPNRFVVSLASALAAAKQFMLAKIPDSIEWMDLQD